jgi:hypothetical protein
MHDRFGFNSDAISEHFRLFFVCLALSANDRYLELLLWALP